MSAQIVAQTIQLVLTPAVMITTCAILLGGLISHYAAINDRLRVMAHERLEIWRSIVIERSSSPAKSDPIITERLQEIDAQLPDLLHRHTLARNALVTGYLAIIVFVATMVTIALAALTQLTAIATTALLLFLAGTVILLVGGLLVAIEVSISHRAVHYETRRIASLNLSPAPPEGQNRIIV